MAVRNMAAINRKTEQMAQEKRAIDQMHRAAIEVYLKTIKESHQDMIDAVDTYNELRKRNINLAFDSGTRIKLGYISYYKYNYAINMDEMEGKVHLYYMPHVETFELYLHGTKKQFRELSDLSDSDITRFFYETGTYKDASDKLTSMLRELAEGITVYLNAFFNAVDNL